MNRRLLAALLLVSGTVITARADTVTDRLLPLLGVHGVEASPASPWQPAPSPTVVVAFQGEDLLRRDVGDLRVAALAGRQGRLTATVALPGTPDQWLTLEAAAGSGDHRGQGRDRDWAASLASTRSLGAVAYRRDGAVHRLAAALRWSVDRGRDQTVDLLEFHRAADDNAADAAAGRRMNRYFWDLLEPTLGDELTYTWDHEELAAELGWSRPLGQDHRLGLLASGRWSTPVVDVVYVNAGERQALRGPRQVALDQDAGQTRLAAGLERSLPAAAHARVEVGYAARDASSLARQRHVPRSASGILLDIVELGRARAEQRGPDVTLQASWEGSPRARLNGHIGWAHSTLDASGEGRTPVLGYSLRTLPISHGGTLALSGNLTTWSASAGGQRRGQRLGVRVHALALRSRYRGHTAADAQMEFGLIVHPVREAAAYDLRLYRLSLAPVLQVTSRTALNCDIIQYAGRLRDRHAVADPEGPRKKHRGGRVYDLRLRYQL